MMMSVRLCADVCTYVHVNMSELLPAALSECALRDCMGLAADANSCAHVYVGTCVRIRACAQEGGS
eukprot:998544-Pyramimonas_sp.AAC.1